MVCTQQAKQPLTIWRGTLFIVQAVTKMGFPSGGPGRWRQVGPPHRGATGLGAGVWTQSKSSLWEEELARSFGVCSGTQETPPPRLTTFLQYKGLSQTP